MCVEKEAWLVTPEAKLGNKVADVFKALGAAAVLSAAKGEKREDLEGNFEKDFSACEVLARRVA